MVKSLFHGNPIGHNVDLKSKVFIEKNGFHSCCLCALRLCCRYLKGNCVIPFGFGFIMNSAGSLFVEGFSCACFQASELGCGTPEEEHRETETLSGAVSAGHCQSDGADLQSLHSDTVSLASEAAISRKVSRPHTLF